MIQYKKIFMTLALLITAVGGAWAQDTDPQVNWNAATKTASFTMPGGNVELQVEYYPESNIFLGKEALADKTNFVVKNDGMTLQFGEDGKSANTVAETNTVTAQYTGGKKILGMKAEKKAAAVPKAAKDATAEDLGKLIGADGNIYDTKADAETAGTTAVAMIAYVGTASDCTHGLAIALADESGTKDYGAAGTACSGKAAVTVGTWRLPSEKDWQYMFIGCGSSESYSAPTSSMSKSYSGLASKLTTAQGDALQTAPYWSSTEDSPGYRAWFVYFDGSVAHFDVDDEYLAYPVRACLAF